MMCIALCLPALGQTDQQDPIAKVLQAYWEAGRAGRFGDAAARREQARDLLPHLPVEAPLFGQWVQSVVSIYQAAGRNAEAREIAEAALARTIRLGDSDSAHTQLLDLLANSWEQDGNLLNCASYLEKMVAALEAAPQDPQPADRFIGIRHFSRLERWDVPGISQLSGAYQRLASIYQRLGRQDQVAEVVAKMKQRADTGPALASLYESQGRLQDAAAIYQKQVTNASNPEMAAWALQALGTFYQRTQQFGDAVSTFQKAIAAMESAATPDARSQSMGMRQSLVSVLTQAGQKAEADQVFQQMLASSQANQDPNYPDLLANYANYLIGSDRASQAEAVLSSYLESHASMEPWEETNLLYALASAVGTKGDSERAAEYQRKAQEKQQSMQTPPPPENSVGSLLQAVVAATQQGNTELAFQLTMQALTLAPGAHDGQQIAWQVPGIAANLASRKEEAKAEQLYQQAFAMTEGWAADNLLPLLHLAMTYAHFLTQSNRRSEVPEAIERYRKLLVSAHGSGTGHLRETFEMSIGFERGRGLEKRAMMAAQDLLALEESLGGTSTEGYMNGLFKVVDLYEASDSEERALPLLRQIVTIADLVYPFNDVRRAGARTRLAAGLKKQEQFEEAERVQREAAEITKRFDPARRPRAEEN